MTAIPSSSSLLVQLADPAVRALVLAGAAGLALLVFRVRNTSVRLFTWTAVLYAALVMPLLGRMLPGFSVPTPEFLQRQAAQHEVALDVAKTAPPKDAQAPEFLTAAEVSLGSRAAPALLPLPPSPLPSSIRWTAIAAGVYLGVTSLLLARFFVGVAFGRRLIRQSHVIDDPQLALRLASHAHVLALARIPQVADSEFISVPVTMGALRSMIVLPAGWREWDDAKLDAVIAHELSHVARRDPLTQHLALLHRAIFWFSPLAWWLYRHLASLAEQASDEAALSCGANRNDYATILLGFFEALQAAPGRVWWQGVSMASADRAEHRAEQRVERILSSKGAIAMSLKKSIALVIVMLAVPVVYLAAAVHPALSNVAPQCTLALQDAAAPSAQSTATAAAAASAARAASYALKSAQSHGDGYSYAYSDDEKDGFVIVSGKTDSLTMSGTTQDAERAEELRKKIQGDFIFFRRGGKAYVIRDQATIDRARKFWAPEEELGKKQEELGKQQEALGKQQEELGDKMEQVHVAVPDMSAELDKLKVELQQLNGGATQEQIGDIQSKIGDLQSKIGELQSQAGEAQSKLGRQQGQLGEQQGRLGEKQGELGRRQGELAREATRQMKKLIDEAIAKGTAQPVEGGSEIIQD